jgi:hypothetical protein
MDNTLIVIWLLLAITGITLFLLGLKQNKPMMCLKGGLCFYGISLTNGISIMLKTLGAM